MMELTYDNILKFMEDYFPAYNRYAQYPETTCRMLDYFAPDLEFIPYVAGLEHTTSADEFLRIMSSHPSSYETITPEDIFIDVKRKVVVVLARTEVVDRKTGQVAVRKRYLPRYRLTTDGNGAIKIKKLIFFWEVLPPGALEVHEVFRRDL
ncbi:MAG: hypothetical protein ABID71_06140 [Chloroflexota bacterium]